MHHINPPNLKQQFGGVVGLDELSALRIPCHILCQISFHAAAMNWRRRCREWSHSEPDLTVLQCEVWCQDVGKWKGWNWKKFQGLVCVIIIAVKLFYKDREAVCACWVCMSDWMTERDGEWEIFSFESEKNNDKREPTKLSFSAGTQLQFHIKSFGCIVLCLPVAGVMWVKGWPTRTQTWWLDAQVVSQAVYTGLDAKLCTGIL